MKNNILFVFLGLCLAQNAMAQGVVSGSNYITSETGTLTGLRFTNKVIVTDFCSKALLPKQHGGYSAFGTNDDMIAITCENDNSDAYFVLRTGQPFSKPTTKVEKISEKNNWFLVKKTYKAELVGDDAKKLFQALAKFPNHNYTSPHRFQNQVLDSQVSLACSDSSCEMTLSVLLKPSAK